MGQHGLDGGLLNVGAGDRQSPWSGMLGLRGNPVQQQRSIRDGFKMLVRLGQTHE